MTINTHTHAHKLTCIHTVGLFLFPFPYFPPSSFSWDYIILYYIHSFIHYFPPFVHILLFFLPQSFIHSFVSFFISFFTPFLSLSFPSVIHLLLSFCLPPTFIHSFPPFVYLSLPIFFLPYLTLSFFSSSFPFFLSPTFILSFPSLVHLFTSFLPLVILPSLFLFLL